MLKKTFVILLLALMLTTPFVSGEPAAGSVYVIPIAGDITPALEQHVAQSLLVAQNDPNTVAVIFEIDTFGGYIDSAVSMSNRMRDVAVPTIAFVNNKAESAGVLLTISADTIVMAPGSTIGSAEPVPNTEKTLSYWAGELRTVAQLKGRDEELVAAMADASIHIPDVVDEGRLLNLTTVEAEELQFTDLVASDYETILSELEIPYGNLHVGSIPARIKIAEWLTNPYVVPVLLALGFIGMIVEVLTPGFGIGGTVGLISFALYFGGGVMAGNAGWAVVLLFLAGITLIVVEAFVPGFGIPGIGGIACLVASIVLAANSVSTAIISLLIAFVLSIIAIVILLKYAPRNPHFNKIVLFTQEKVEHGYVSSKVKYDHLVGESGVVRTFLRPVGTVEINGQVLEAVSEGNFLEEGAAVQVIKVEGRKIIVRKKG